MFGDKHWNREAVKMSGYFDGRDGRLSKTWRFRRSSV